MATLRGLFLADFGDFYNACLTAETKLVDFAQGAGRVEGALNRMVDSFSGRKVIQEATLMAEAIERSGGASKLTATELERAGAKAAEAAAKMTAMGLDVPPGIARIAAEAKTAGGSLETMKGIATSLAGAFGVAFSIGAAVQFGKALLDDAGALVDLNAKTGVSIEQLQRFAFVGKQANVSVEDFAQASFKLGVALEGGDKSVVKAVERLGLSYVKLRQDSPDDQWNTTVAALERVTSETERNRLGVDLMGKSFATVAPAIAKGYSDMAAQAQVSTTAQITAIDNASDAWDRWVAKQKTGITSALGNWALAQEQLGKLNEEQLRVYHNMIATADFTGAQKYLLNLAAQVDIVLPKEEKHATLTKEQQVAAEKLAAAMVELNAAGVGWKGTLDTINGDIVESIKFYLAAGVSQQALATAFGLTDVQVKAIATSLKDAEEAQKKWAAAENAFAAQALKHAQELRAAENQHGIALLKTASEGYDAIQKAAATFHDFEMKESMDTATYQIMKIWEKADAEIKAFKGTEEQAQTHADLIYSIANYEAKAITDVMNSAADAMAKKAQALLTAMAGTWAQYQAALDAASPNMFGTRPVPLGPMGPPSGWGTGRYGPNGEDLWAVRWPSRDSGGAVSAGQPVYIGTGAQPELFIPSTAGLMVPRGGGAVSIVNHIYVNGTAADVARQVASEILRTVKQGTKLGAT